MGILNVTPDSFSDGGRFVDPDVAFEHANQMLDDGADIIDIGGESTRPATFRDQTPLDPKEEIARIAPVIRRLASSRPGVCISVDTYKADVAEAALEAGANVLNDISGLGYDARMADLASSSRCPLILMHLPGTPRQMPENPQYGDIIADIADYFKERVLLARTAGVSDDRIVLDPGLGFGKNSDQNAEIIRRMAELKALGYPILSGPSRKRFLGALLGDAPSDDRLEGTAASVALSIAAGADIVRVHDVRFMARLAKVCDALSSRPTPSGHA
jgi:dihydropteroate synthase